jgi:hypothetical protein
MEPAWHAASDALAAAGSNVKLAKIDASDPTNQSVGGLYGVRGYPTMKTFKDGACTAILLIFTLMSVSCPAGNVGDYTGPRETEGIVAWVNSNMN